jgi:hypothetical protein
MEITSGNLTVFALDEHETHALGVLLGDWIDDSLTRGIDCADTDVIQSYRHTLGTLRDLFDSFDITVEPNALDALIDVEAMR